MTYSEVKGFLMKSVAAISHSCRSTNYVFILRNFKKCTIISMLLFVRIRGFPFSPEIRNLSRYELDFFSRAAQMNLDFEMSSLCRVKKDRIHFGRIPKTPKDPMPINRR